jgi:hypothetical protein
MATTAVLRSTGADAIPTTELAKVIRKLDGNMTVVNAKFSDMEKSVAAELKAQATDFQVKSRDLMTVINAKFSDMERSLATELKSQAADFRANSTDLKHQILASHTQTNDKIANMKLDLAKDISTAKDKAISMMWASLLTVSDVSMVAISYLLIMYRLQRRR